MKKHKRSATGHSQWNCSFSCGTAVNNYKWVIQPTSADSALLPDFKSFAPRRHLHHSLLQPAALRMHGQCCQGKGGGRGKEWKCTQKVQERARGIFLCLSRRSNCDMRACGAPCMGLGRIAVGSAPQAGGTLWRSGWGGAGRAPGHGQLHGGAAVPELCPCWFPCELCSLVCGAVEVCCLSVMPRPRACLCCTHQPVGSQCGMVMVTAELACRRVPAAVPVGTAQPRCCAPLLPGICFPAVILARIFPPPFQVVWEWFPEQGSRMLSLRQKWVFVALFGWLSSFRFLRASQGALHECTRCRSCLFSPGCSFNLKEITCSFPIA